MTPTVRSIDGPYAGECFKALQGEIGRILLFFCFAMKQFSEQAMRGEIIAQGVQ